MLRTFIAFIALHGVVARLQHKISQVNETYTQKIVIVGAGIAGVSAAKRLEEAGYTDITILEKNNYVGGKCRTTFYEDYKGTFENGAAVFSRRKHPLIAGLVEEYELETTKLPPKSTLADPLNFGHDFFEDETFFVESLGDEGKIKLQEEIDLFNELFLIDDMSKPGYINLDPRLSISFSQWCNENNVLHLQQQLIKTITSWGYGYLSTDTSGEIALPYVMKYKGKLDDVIPSNAKLGSNLGQYERSAQETDEETDDYYDPPGYYRTIDVGFQGLVNSIADSLQHTDIRTSSTVTKFDRETDSIVIQYMKDGQDDLQEETFDKAIVAFPETISNLHASGTSLSEEETELFSKVRIRNYYGLYIPLEFFNFGMYMMNLEPGSAADVPKITLRAEDGYPSWIVVVPREDNGKALVRMTIYSENDLTMDEVAENVISYIKSLCNETVTVEDFREFTKYDYHAHVDAEDFGFYDEINDIQGDKNTFWVGGLFQFESTEFTVGFSNYLVDKYF